MNEESSTGMTFMGLPWKPFETVEEWDSSVATNHLPPSTLMALLDKDGKIVGFQ